MHVQNKKFGLLSSCKSSGLLVCTCVAMLLPLGGCFDTQEMISRRTNLGHKKYHPQNYTKNLVQIAQSGQYNAIQDRPQELKLLKASLLEKNNVLLVGPTGVGKTTLFQLLAKHIAQNRAGSAFNHRALIRVDLVKIKELLDTQGGVLPQTYAQLLQRAVEWSHEVYGLNTIVFVDEVQTLVSGTSSNSGSRARQFATALAPLLSAYKGIGFATTVVESLSVDARNPNVPLVYVSEPEYNLLMSMLRSRAAVLTKQHGVNTTQATLDLAVKLSVMNLFRVSVPAAVFDLLTEAMTKTRIRGKKILTEQELLSSAAASVGVSVEKLLYDVSIADVNRVIQEKNALHLQLVDTQFSADTYRNKLNLLEDTVLGRFSMPPRDLKIHQFRNQQCHLIQQKWDKFCSVRGQATCKQPFAHTPHVQPCRLNSDICVANTTSKQWDDPCNLVSPDDCGLGETRGLCKPAEIRSQNF